MIVDISERLFIIFWRRWKGMHAFRLPDGRSVRIVIGWLTIGWNA